MRLHQEMRKEIREKSGRKRNTEQNPPCTGNPDRKQGIPSISLCH